jgi:hypothetical protein
LKLPRKFAITALNAPQIALSPSAVSVMSSHLRAHEMLASPIQLELKGFNLHYGVTQRSNSAGRVDEQALFILIIFRIKDVHDKIQVIIV